MPVQLPRITHRHSHYIQKHKWKYLEDDLFEIAAGENRQRGFGYVGYNFRSRSIFDQQARYGIALVDPAWVVKEVEKLQSVRLISYTERHWDDHQDVLIIGRPDVNA